MQFTSLTAYSIILSLVLIVLLSICFSQHFTSSISISEKIAYVWEMMKTDWTPGWSWKIFMFALWQATILVIRCFTYYLLFISLLSYSILLVVRMHISLKSMKIKRLNCTKIGNSDSFCKIISCKDTLQRIQFNI